MRARCSLYADTYNRIESTHGNFFSICICFVIRTKRTVKWKLITMPNHAHVCVARMKIFVYWFYSHAQWKFIHGPQMHTLKLVQQFPNVRSPRSIFIAISFRSLRIAYGKPRISIAQNVTNSLSIFSSIWGSLNGIVTLFCLNIWFLYIHIWNLTNSQRVCVLFA